MKKYLVLLLVMFSFLAFLGTGVFAAQNKELKIVSFTGKTLKIYLTPGSKPLTFVKERGVIKQVMADGTKVEAELPLLSLGAIVVGDLGAKISLQAGEASAVVYEAVAGKQLSIEIQVSSTPGGSPEVVSVSPPTSTPTETTSPSNTTSTGESPKEVSASAPTPK